MAELKNTLFNSGISEDFVSFMRNLWSWEKVEVSEDMTRADFYVAENVFLRFENHIGIKISFYKGDTLINSGVAGGGAYTVTCVETLKTSRALMLRFDWNTKLEPINSSSTGRYIIENVKSITGDTEKTAIVYVTPFNTTRDNNKLLLITDDAGEQTAACYTMAQFDSLITTIAPLTHPQTSYVSQSVYTVHSSQLGGVNLHSPCLINNVNYYIYGTLAFKD